MLGQPPLAQSSPALPTTPHVINVRTVDSGVRQVVVCQSTPTHPMIRVVQSTDPHGSRTPVTTKVIRIPQAQTSSLLQRSGGSGVPIVGAQTPNGQRIVQRVVSAGTPGSAGRIITISRVANGSSTPQSKNVIMTPQGGVVTSQGMKNIIVTTQGANGSGAVPKKIYVTCNGQSLGPVTTTANSQVLLANLGQSPQLLQTAGGGQRLVINQANGQLLRVTHAPPTTACVSLTSGTTRVVNAVQEQTRIIHSPSVGQLQSIARTVAGSPLQIINKSSLSGAKVITASSAPSPGPAPSTFHHSPSMPLLTNGVSRSDSPVYGMGNIPTVVPQKLSVGSIGSLSSSSLPVKQPVTSKDLSRLWHTDDMKMRTYNHASPRQVMMRMLHAKSGLSYS